VTARARAARPYNRGVLVRAVPNLLSALRLAIAAAFAWLPPSLRPWAILAAGLSDWLDGWIARRFQATTWAGGVLDAVADKSFVVAVLATLVHEGVFEAWQAALLLLRDLSVLVAAAYFAARREWSAFTKMPSRWFGKVTTAVLFGLFLAVAALPEARVAHAALLFAGIAASGLAALDYGRTFLRARASARSAGAA
jgi:CDP-diacylglycerol--glycerol-3-phosphate 3-phosphatidyltransferase/cardiolipin synthase